MQNKCTSLDGKNKIYSTKNIYCGVMGKHLTYILGSMICFKTNLYNFYRMYREGTIHVNCTG